MRNGTEEMSSIKKNNSKKSKYIKYIPVILWTAFIFFNSLMPAEESSHMSFGVMAMVQKLLQSIHIIIEEETLHFLVRKAAHFTEYAVLGVLTKNASENKYKILIVIGFITPIIDETIQYFVPGRAMAFRDMCIDAAGFFTGALLFHLIIQKTSKRNNPEK